MCYTRKTWHRCGVHYRQEPQYCARAPRSATTENLNSCGNPEGTADAGFTGTFCNNANCPFTKLGGMYTCCQCRKTRVMVEICDGCQHTCYNNCTPWEMKSWPLGSFETMSEGQTFVFHSLKTFKNFMIRYSSCKSPFSLSAKCASTHSFV